MSARLPRSPQIGRIARLLNVDPQEIRGLDDLNDRQLRELHDMISEAYFGPGRDRFARVAGLAKVLPAALAGKLAERFLPPQLAARAAEQLDPARAHDLVERVSIGYLADLAVELDPTRSKPVIQAIPADRVADVAAEIFRRGEYAAAAEIAGAVRLDGLFAALAVARAHDLIELVPLLVWTDEIETVVDDTPAAQLDGILDEIAFADRWDDGSYLVDHLSPSARCRALERLARSPDSTFARFRDAARGGRLGDAAAQLVADAAQARAAADLP